MVAQRDVITILEDIVQGVDDLATLQGGGDTTALLTAIKNAVDGLETLITATNTHVDQLEGYTDGLETLVGSTNTKLDTANANLATAAKQDTSQTTLAGVLGALVLLQHPTISTAVTPLDATDITTFATKGLFIGTTGNVSAKLVGDSVAKTWKNVPSGSYIPGAFKNVMTATTAADIIALSGP